MHTIEQSSGPHEKTQAHSSIRQAALRHHTCCLRTVPVKVFMTRQGMAMVEFKSVLGTFLSSELLLLIKIRSLPADGFAAEAECRS